MAGFEEAPEEREESFPCPRCSGNVTKNGEIWECDSCNFSRRET